MTLKLILNEASFNVTFLISIYINFFTFLIYIHYLSSNLYLMFYFSFHNLHLMFHNIGYYF